MVRTLNEEGGALEELHDVTVIKLDGAEALEDLLEATILHRHLHPTVSDEHEQPGGSDEVGEDKTTSASAPTSCAGGGHGSKPAGA